MKYILLLIPILLISCLEDVKYTEYQTLEVDMVEYCRGKLDGYYYVGPKDGYNLFEITEEISPNSGDFSGEKLLIKTTLDYIYGKGFALTGPSKKISIK